MVDETRLAEITRKLLEYGKEVANNELFPTLLPEAASLVANDPYAFLIAVCLDRGSLADVIWSVPYYMKQELGHLDPKIIHEMTLDDLDHLFKRLKKKPHYINASPRTVLELTQLVVDKCDGDASSLWRGKSALEVAHKLDSIYGVGVGIANMGVLLIEKAFSIDFPDKSFMDIKADTHTMRVLYRIGVSESVNEESAMRAARKMNPLFPGELDPALWVIGRKLCRPSDPNCPECPMDGVCLKCML